jgi:hypothetical protein
LLFEVPLHCRLRCHSYGSFVVATSCHHNWGYGSPMSPIGLRREDRVPKCLLTDPRISNSVNSTTSQSRDQTKRAMYTNEITTTTRLFLLSTTTRR